MWNFKRFKKNQVLPRIGRAALGFLIFSLFFLGTDREAWSCRYTIRDVGFVDLVPHPYHLYIFTETLPPDELLTRLTSISSGVLADSNVRIEWVSTSGPIRHEAQYYLDFWKVPSLPAAVLVSPFKTSTVMPLELEGGSLENALWEALNRTVSSEARQNFLDRIIKSYCVVLLIEGRDDEENVRVSEILTGVSRKIEKLMRQLPVHIDDPPSIIRIPQTRLSDEKVLLWSLGVDAAAVEDPIVITLIGRGRQFGPRLVGGQVSESRVYNIFSLISLSCDCGQDVTRMIGPLIPLSWDKSRQAQVVRNLGFDAENPIVKREISMVLSLEKWGPLGEPSEFPADESALGEYSEDIVRPEGETSGNALSPAQIRDLISTGESGDSKFLQRGLLLLGAFIVLIMSTGVFILWRTRKKRQ